MKRLLTLLALAGSLLITTAPAVWAHDVKDPVCRMTVDSDTAKWKHRLGNRSYYFCSKDCQAKFSANPAKYEKLAAQLEKQDLHEYVVDFKPPTDALAGRPTRLEFTVRYKKSGEPVKEFERIHERLMHFIMTTADMSWFEHQHPKQIGDGTFELTWTFPRPGSYRLYADFTPADGDNQVIPLSLTVGGSGLVLSYPLTPDAKRVKQIGDLRFELKLQGQPLRMEKPVLLTYTVRDRKGRPVKDLHPFIGAMGHLLAISQDGKEVVHTHALQSISQPIMKGEKEPFRVTRAMVTEKGPAFSFKLTVPTGGLYKTWAQFARGGKVYTVPFTFLVQDLWAKTPAAPAARGAVQKATVVIDGEYQPGRVTVKAGKPVELTFVRREKAGCGEVVQFPSLGIKRTLKPGETAVIRFTPRRAGTIPFTCGMKMYKGQVAAR
jgi:YHS domain-containing protein